MLSCVKAWSDGGYGIAGDSYEFQGYSQPEVQYKGNTVKTTARGKRRIKFRDGTVIEITYPKYYLRGQQSCLDSLASHIYSESASDAACLIC